MAQRWFVSHGEHVYGPWSTEDVKSHRRDGNIMQADVIWGIGESSWVSVANWDPTARTTPKATPVAAPVTARVSAAPIAAQPAALEEVTKISRARSTVDDETVVRHAGSAVAEAWHLAYDGRSLGPFTRPALMVELRRLASLDNVSLWTKGMREWAPVTEFLDILNELGADQRQHARAAIKGQATLKYDGLTQSAPLSSISEGGFGLHLDSDFMSGQIVNVEVQSPGLGEVVRATAEIRFSAGGCRWS